VEKWEARQFITAIVRESDDDQVVEDTYQALLADGEPEVIGSLIYELVCAACCAWHQVPKWRERLSVYLYGPEWLEYIDAELQHQIELRKKPTPQEVEYGKTFDSP
jgi:hypothetical protein